MKVGTKPISSPGRAAEKYYPQPLMRFLRSNVGSQSRGRSSRSSPLMFVRKKNNHNHNNNHPSSSFENQQEPSSPKVTCMGQVRVRRSSKHKQPSINIPSSSPTRPGVTRCSCINLPNWVQHSASCYCLLNDKIKVKQPHKTFATFRRPSCLKWVFLFPNRKGNSSREEDSTNTPQKNVEQSEEGEGGERVRAYISAGTICSPPKNALLLTRCRSAPYRSSSLACRFWGSPLGSNNNNNNNNSEETEEPKQRVDFVQEEANKGNENLPTSKRDSSSKEESDEGLESEVEVGALEGFEVPIDLSRHGNGFSKNMKVEGLRREVEDGGGTGGRTLRPLTLTRCKSEPARTGEKNPEMGFWKKRRLGFR